MAMNQSCYGLRGNAGDAFFTYYSTKRLVEALQQRAHGSVFDTITRDTLAGVHVALPNVPAITAFEAMVAPIMERIRVNLTQAQALSTLRDTLLPRLVSGRLRLPEAESMAAQAASQNDAVPAAQAHGAFHAD
jgi:type I restriction enzyme S subunit